MCYLYSCNNPITCLNKVLYVSYKVILNFTCLKRAKILFVNSSYNDLQYPSFNAHEIKHKTDTHIQYKLLMYYRENTNFISLVYYENFNRLFP